MKFVKDLNTRLLLFFSAGFAVVILLLRAQDNGGNTQAQKKTGEDPGPYAQPAAWEAARPPLEPSEGSGNVIRRLGDFVPRNHLTLKRFDAQMSAVAWTNFVVSLDFDKSYFLQSDIDRFAEMRGRLGEILQSGDTSWAYGVFEVYKERLADRYAFVTNQLAHTMDFSVEESYEWNRRKAEWPATEEERDDLWRRKIKNEYLVYLIGKEIEQEAASNRVAKAEREWRPGGSFVYDNGQMFVINADPWVFNPSPIPERLKVGEVKWDDHALELLGMNKARMGALFQRELEQVKFLPDEWRVELPAPSAGEEVAVADDGEEENEEEWTFDFDPLGVKEAETVGETVEAKAAEPPKPAAPPITPESVVEGRYRQWKTVTEDYDADFVLQRFASAIVSAYDPHSDYLSPAKAEDFNIEMGLKLTGIGAQLRSEDGAALVVELIPGGPAEQDTRDIRLRAKDKIIGVGQGDGEIEDVMHLPIDKTVRKIRGPKGTKVVLQVISGSDPTGTDTRLIDLMRDEVKLEEQAATGRVERVTLPDGSTRNLGVVRLPAFYRTFDQRPGSKDFRSAAQDVATEIARLNNEDIEGLVLDLRNNGGGALAEAVDLTALFVKSGPVVQVREPRGIQALQIQETGIAGPMFRKPMVTLVNRTSASASEIVAGALQDYGRSLIVGDSKTHGKGTVQTVMPLGGRFGDKALGQAKLTTATFYRITGASTQLRGITPDIIIPSTLDAIEIGEEFLPNPLPWTQIDGVLFAPVFRTGDTIAQLRERSDERLANDEKYQRYHRLVEHLGRLGTDSTVPLERGARKAHALEEREMRRLQDLEDEEGGDADDDDAPPRRGRGNPADDIVLREALQILSDLITLTDGREVPLSGGNNLQGGMLKFFGGF